MGPEKGEPANGTTGYPVENARRGRVAGEGEHELVANEVFDLGGHKVLNHEFHGGNE